MTNYDDGDTHRNEDRNDDGNVASGSGSDGPIIYPITTPRSHRGGSGDDINSAVVVEHCVSMCWTIYLPYKDHIKYMP